MPQEMDRDSESELLKSGLKSHQLLESWNPDLRKKLLGFHKNVLRE